MDVGYEKSGGSPPSYNENGRPQNRTVWARWEEKSLPLEGKGDRVSGG